MAENKWVRSLSPDARARQHYAPDRVDVGPALPKSIPWGARTLPYQAEAELAERALRMRDTVPPKDEPVGSESAPARPIPSGAGWFPIVSPEAMTQEAVTAHYQAPRITGQKETGAVYNDTDYTKTHMYLSGVNLWPKLQYYGMRDLPPSAQIPGGLIAPPRMKPERSR